MDSFTRFLNRLRELIKGKVKDGDLTAAEFDAAVASARGHVGGTIRWENAKSEANHMNEWRLMSELSLSGDKKSARIQIFPKVQKYDHPRYGELDISPDFLRAVKANFDAKAYQQDLPLTIDLEHETKLSGAAGWIKDVTIDGDKGMFATVEFNDRGEALVADGGFKYFSPEFYDTWTDPATGAQYDNVLIGGALTNRPFFKGMQPVAMMREGSLLFIEAAGDMPDMEAMMAQMQAMMDMMAKMGDKMPEGAMSDMQGLMSKMKKAPMQHAGLSEAGVSEAEASAALVDLELAENDTGGSEMNEEEARQFREETQAQLRTLSERVAAAEAKAASEEEARKAAEGEAKQASERVQALERAATRKQLSEHVKANRLAYQGEVDEAVDRLERLSIKLGEEDFADYLREREAQHGQMKESVLFSQLGNQQAKAGVEAEFQAAVKKTMSENPGMSEPDATVKAAESNPALYKRFDDAFKLRTKRGGE